MSWGPDVGGGDGVLVKPGETARGRPSGLVVGLLLGGFAVLALIAALALRGSEPATVSPTPPVPPVPAAAPSTASLPDDGTSSPAPARVVEADAFYSTGALVSSGCREPRAAPATRAAVEAYYTGLVACLNKAWAPKVRAAQDTFMPPRVVSWAGYQQSPCASGPASAFYCDSTQTLYLNYDAIKAWSRSADDVAARGFARMWATDTVARLYGHHVQQLTGILADAHQRTYVAPDLRLQQGRRLELQATCLSAVFIGANRSSYGLTDLDLSIYRQYVVPQHGASRLTDRATVANRQYWAARGLGTRDVASCNTFTAPARNTS